MFFANYIIVLNFIHYLDASERVKGLYLHSPEGIKFIHSQITQQGKFVKAEVIQH